MTQPRQPKGTRSGGQYATQPHGESSATLDGQNGQEGQEGQNDPATRALHWSEEGVVGKQLLGFPGSRITAVEPTADYLVNGPNTHTDSDFIVRFRADDGRDLAIPKPYRWLAAQQRDPEAKVTTNSTSGSPRDTIATTPSRRRW